MQAQPRHADDRRGTCTRWCVGVLVVAGALTGCTTGSQERGATPSSSPASRPPPLPSDSASASSSPTKHAAPPFASHVTAVTQAQVGRSWRPGCPVPPSQLRSITLRYWGFDRRAHQGTLLVNARVVHPIVTVFRRIYRARFPIRRMVPVAEYGGSDNASMAADNTSGFNCRNAVTSAGRAWSMHAYGEAVDFNPVENPYILDGRVYPPNGHSYTNRTVARRGMVVPGSAPVRALLGVGWGWGGNWASTPDYQHFSANGR